MRKVLFVFFVICVSLSTGIAQSISFSDDFKHGEISVRLSANEDVHEFISDFNQKDLGFQVSMKMDIAPRWGMYLLNLLPAETNVLEAVELLNQQPKVLNSFSSRYVKPRNNPDDPLFPSQWSLERIGITDVWNETTGGTTIAGDKIVVAVLDSGFDIEHPDLKPNLWVNDAEIPNDGIDNDGNGLVDDVHGYNFEFNRPDFTVAGHGTAVSGIIGGKGNNGQFMTGINWDLEIMLFEVFTFPQVYAGYYYAEEQRRLYNETNGQQGAFVVATNSSFGADGRCTDISAQEFNIAFDSLGKVGILSAAATININQNIDLTGDIPTSCESQYLITIANSDNSDRLFNSGFGKETIDIAAPGQDVPVIWRDDSDRLEKGTSMSTPHVSGAVALLYSLNCAELIDRSKSDPSTMALILKEFLLGGAEKTTDLESRVLSGGRLNVKNSMDLIYDWCFDLVDEFQIVKLYPNPTNSIINVEYKTPDFNEFPIRIFNVLGQQVDELTHNPDPTVGGIFEIDLSNFADGVYFLSFEKNGVTVIEQVVKVD